MKSPMNNFMCIMSVLVIMTGFLTIMPWDADAANAENVKIVREMQTSGRYEGCTILHPADNPYKRVIAGSCAGYVFKSPELSSPGEEMKACQLQDLGSRVWVADCFIDGQWRPGSTEITEAVVKPPAQYLGLVARARARSKVDPVFLGIVLGEQWDQQSVNKCSGSEPRTKIIPFCSYGDKDRLVSHAGVPWTDCVAIDNEKFDITWLKVPDDEAGKRPSCRVYVSVLSDGTVGKISMVTDGEMDQVRKINDQLRKKYGNQDTTKPDSITYRRLFGTPRQPATMPVIHLWTLPGLTVSYREVDPDGSLFYLTGVLEVYTGAPASVIVEDSKPTF